MTMTSHEKYVRYLERADNQEVIDFLNGSELCFSCHTNVYEYVTEDKVNHGIISGCPICHRSFCD